MWSTFFTPSGIRKQSQHLDFAVGWSGFCHQPQRCNCDRASTLLHGVGIWKPSCPSPIKLKNGEYDTNLETNGQLIEYLPIVILLSTSAFRVTVPLNLMVFVESPNNNSFDPGAFPFVMIETPPDRPVPLPKESDPVP